MDEKTARKYRSLGALPSTQKRPRTYRTRKDPLEDLWQAGWKRSLASEPKRCRASIPASSPTANPARSSGASSSGAPRPAGHAR